MSVSEREVPFEVARDGGFPTAEEFDRVCSAILAVDDHGLQPLLRRIAGPLVDSYEGDDGQRIDFTYADIGLLVAKAEILVDAAESLRDATTYLRKIAGDIAAAIENGGSVESLPELGRDGSLGYVPSRASLERWGLVKAKEADDAR